MTDIHAWKFSEKRKIMCPKCLNGELAWYPEDKKEAFVELLYMWSACFRRAKCDLCDRRFMVPVDREIPDKVVDDPIYTEEETLDDQIREWGRHPASGGGS